MSGSNCCFFSCIPISQEAGKVIWYSHLFKNFPQFVVIHTVKGFSIISEAEVDIFSNSLAFSMIHRMLAIYSLVPLPFLNAAWTPESSWFMYCWWEWTRSEFMLIGIIFSKQCTCWLTTTPTSAEPSPQQGPSGRKIHLTQIKIWASFMYEMFIFYRLVQMSKGTLMPIHTSLLITYSPGNWLDQWLHKQLSYFYHWLVSVLRTIDSNISLLDNSVERILHISTSCVQNQNPDFPPKPALPPVFCISIPISDHIWSYSPLFSRIPYMPSVFKFYGLYF